MPLPLTQASESRHWCPQSHPVPECHRPVFYSGDHTDGHGVPSRLLGLWSAGGVGESREKGCQSWKDSLAVAEPGDSGEMPCGWKECFRLQVETDTSVVRVALAHPHTGKTGWIRLGSWREGWAYQPQPRSSRWVSLSQGRHAGSVLHPGVSWG